MRRVLFVTNGHGEAAIADRIALELTDVAAQAQRDHLALVGESSSLAMDEVGPRRAMPSGGLIAMGNARNLLQDLRAGLLSLTWQQVTFLHRVRNRYDAAVAVGDAYALAMTLLARSPTIFIGSAKSVEVAPYGPFEARLLRRATACFVRDEATAAALRRRGLHAEVANAIVDLFSARHSADVESAIRGFEPALALFPGSRESAYAAAAFMLDVMRELSATRPSLGAVLSVAPGLDAARFASAAQRDGWEVRTRAQTHVPFALSRGGREIVRGWRAPLGPLLESVPLVLGQAGTANEAAAAAGVPVIAFEWAADQNARWYRQRQRDLLGEALAVVDGNAENAAHAVIGLLDDPVRRKRMGEVGRARMGSAGGARRIAERIGVLLGAT
jgi:uncharacterized protein (TIGR03492 family)